MCRAHATVRGLLREIVAGAEDVAVADMEAGLEHFSRGTPRHVDVVLAVLEPYYRSLETGARVAELARDLGVGRVYAVANKVRDDADRSSIEGFCRQRSIALAGTIPHDEAIVEADRAGGALLDRSPASPAVAAVAALAEALLSGAAAQNV
jgi:CO dehydrogenase maturation factor